MTEARRGESGIGELAELRIRLDQMTERITGRFKDRSRFPINPAVYEIDGIPITDRSGISLLHFALEGLESYHASLGRYDYSDQFPVLGTELPTSRVIRTKIKPPLLQLNINSSEALIPFYQSLISRSCVPGDDPESYGETAYIDADLIQLIHERVNIGRYVAQVKAKNDPSILSVKSDRPLLLSRLKDSSREEALLEKVRITSDTYGLNSDMTADAFRWIIDKTLDIEIAYIQQI